MSSTVGKISNCQTKSDKLLIFPTVYTAQCKTNKSNFKKAQEEQEQEFMQN